MSWNGSSNDPGGSWIGNAPHTSSGGDASDWSQYPARTDVDIANRDLRNVNNLFVENLIAQQELYENLTVDDILTVKGHAILENNLTVYRINADILNVTTEQYTDLEVTNNLTVGGDLEVNHINATTITALQETYVNLDVNQNLNVGGTTELSGELTLSTNDIRGVREVYATGIELGTTAQYNGVIRPAAGRSIIFTGGTQVLMGKNSFTSGITHRYNSSGEDGSTQYRGTGGAEGTIVTANNVSMYNGSSVATGRLTHDKKLIFYGADENTGIQMDGTQPLQLNISKQDYGGSTHVDLLTLDETQAVIHPPLTCSGAVTMQQSLDVQGLMTAGQLNVATINVQNTDFVDVNLTGEMTTRESDIQYIQLRKNELNFFDPSTDPTFKFTLGTAPIGGERKLYLQSDDDGTLTMYMTISESDVTMETDMTAKNQLTVEGLTTIKADAVVEECLTVQGHAVFNDITYCNHQLIVRDFIINEGLIQTDYIHATNSSVQSLFKSIFVAGEATFTKPVYLNEAVYVNSTISLPTLHQNIEIDGTLVVNSSTTVDSLLCLGLLNTADATMEHLDVTSSSNLTNMSVSGFLNTSGSISILDNSFISLTNQLNNIEPITLQCKSLEDVYGNRQNILEVQRASTNQDRMIIPSQEPKGFYYEGPSPMLTVTPFRHTTSTLGLGGSGGQIQIMLPIPNNQNGSTTIGYVGSTHDFMIQRYVTNWSIRFTLDNNGIPISDIFFGFRDINEQTGYSKDQTFGLPNGLHHMRATVCAPVVVPSGGTPIPTMVYMIEFI